MIPLSIAFLFLVSHHLVVEPTTKQISQWNSKGFQIISNRWVGVLSQRTVRRIWWFPPKRVGFTFNYYSHPLPDLFFMFLFFMMSIFIYTMYSYIPISYTCKYIYICNVNSSIEQVGHKDSSQWMGNHQVRHLLPVAGLKLSRDPMITGCWHDVLWEK